MPSTVLSSVASGASCTFGSVRISSRKRWNPAMPSVKVSMKNTRVRIGETNVVTYSENVIRST